MEQRKKENKQMPLSLPAQKSLALSIDEGIPEDYHLVRLYYTWYSGWFYRHRLRMIANLLGSPGEARIDRILEVGVGSGIFLKELLKRARFVAGIDIHKTYHGVRAMLKEEGADLERVDLRQGSIFDIPYRDESFDAVVCISVLEHFEDPRPALREMRRVTKPGGMLALGFPARIAITDMLFRMVGYDPREIHPASHTMILDGIQEVLLLEKTEVFPSGLVPFYFACRARRTE